MYEMTIGAGFKPALTLSLKNEGREVTRTMPKGAKGLCHVTWHQFPIMSLLPELLFALGVITNCQYALIGTSESAVKLTIVVLRMLLNSEVV
jgi:hypothetical protein